MSRHLFAGLVFSGLVAGATLLCAIAPSARAQDYPSRPVKIIVPFGAGGPADVYARVLAQYLGETLKQPFVVENRPGAGSIIGTDAVAKIRPGRLHAAVDVEHAHRQRIADAEQAVRADERFRRGRADQLFRPDDGGASIGAGEDAEGIHRAREVEAGRAQLRVVRPGHAVSHGWRTVQGHGGTDIVHVPHKGFGRGAQRACSAAMCR